MAQCEVCGNEYDRTMEISVGGEAHVYDSFECAIHAIAPQCPHCGCRIIGHGVQVDDAIFCCAHCATESGAHGVTDRA
jgi:nitrite reductase/ring-hydroxylating ferredoxin subunit